MAILIEKMISHWMLWGGIPAVVSRVTVGWRVELETEDSTSRHPVVYIFLPHVADQICFVPRPIGDRRAFFKRLALAHGGGICTAGSVGHGGLLGKGKGGAQVPLPRINWTQGGNSKDTT